MLKKSVQQGRSEWQRVKGRGVPSGYVEGLNDARTMLAGFFSIRLVEYHGFSAIHQHPSFNMAAHGAGQDNLLQITTFSYQNA